MRVAGKLEIHGRSHSLVEMRGLVVEKKKGLGRVKTGSKRGERGTVAILTVVAAQEIKGTVDLDDRVAENANTGTREKAKTAVDASDILVVAETSVHAKGSAESQKALVGAGIVEGAGVVVDDVPGDQDSVGMLGVDKLHPAIQFAVADGVAEVQVADQDEGILPSAEFAGVDGKLDALLDKITDVAGKKDNDGEAGEGIIERAALEGEKVEPVEEIAGEGGEEEIKEDEDPGGADGVEEAGEGSRKDAGEDEREDHGGSEQESAGDEGVAEEGGVAGDVLPEAEEDVAVSTEVEEEGEDDG